MKENFPQSLAQQLNLAQNYFVEFHVTGYSGL